MINLVHIEGAIFFLLFLLWGVLTLGFFIASFIGIRRATNRIKTKERSDGAARLAFIGTAVVTVTGWLGGWA